MFKKLNYAPFIEMPKNNFTLIFFYSNITLNLKTQYVLQHTSNKAITFNRPRAIIGK